MAVLVPVNPAISVIVSVIIMISPIRPDSRPSS